MIAIVYACLFHSCIFGEVCYTHSLGYGGLAACCDMFPCCVQVQRCSLELTIHSLLHASVGLSEHDPEEFLSDSNVFVVYLEHMVSYQWQPGSVLLTCCQLWIACALLQCSGLVVMSSQTENIAQYHPGPGIALQFFIPLIEQLNSLRS